jgi:hypothetical protein
MFFYKDQNLPFPVLVWSMYDDNSLPEFLSLHKENKTGDADNRCYANCLDDNDPSGDNVRNNTVADAHDIHDNNASKKGTMLSNIPDNADNTRENAIPHM